MVFSFSRRRLRKSTNAAIPSRARSAQRCGWIHPLNVAKLALDDEHPVLCRAPPSVVCVCSAKPALALSGANVAVLGRSMIVGKPMALLLMRKGIDATRHGDPFPHQEYCVKFAGAPM